MSDLQDAAIQAAETIQTAHIQQAPSAEHDVAPSTAAETKRPVTLDRSADPDDLEDVDDDEIPVSILKPTPRRPQMPPLPDLRFEQSYLASVKDAKGWQGVAVITLRDQVLMPLVQGMAWTLIVSGWRVLNNSSKFSGQSIGAKIRRWWWSVNEWAVPEHSQTLRDRKTAEEVSEFMTAQFSSTGDD